MVSVLIPIYNQNCSELIFALQQQIELLDVPVEIIAIDDASIVYKEENRKAITCPNHKYIELNNNIGRAAIRNKLATIARYEYLLFMDCDTYPASDSFLLNYIQCIHSNVGQDGVICGGYKYSLHPPENPQQLFRWKYGKKREEKPAAERNKSPYKSFSSFNFCIHNKVFSTIRFDETIKGYGHEDTWFGIALKENKISVVHIDNELFQVFIDDTAMYLEKSRNAVKNLYTLYTTSDKMSMFEQIKLVRVFEKTKKMGLCSITVVLYELLQQTCEQNFYSKKPSLALFDFYRLGLLCREYSKSKRK
jgi:glycosyltransferase involved in cell wall biosynthesis